MSLRVRVILTGRNSSVKALHAHLNDEMTTMPNILAIDAGGTSTRAVVVDESGNCLGFGQSGGGNPISAGFGPALAALAEATSLAQATSGPRLSSALIAMAGATSRMPRQELKERFIALGLHGELTLESDLLAMFRSGTLAPSGYALIAATGGVLLTAHRDIT